MRKFFTCLIALLTFVISGDAMEPRVNIITLGVKEISRSKKFYESLGLTASSISNDHFVAFPLNGLVLCLYPEEALAEDAQAKTSREGFRGVTLAYNVGTKEEVDNVLNEARSVGAKIVKEGQEVFWGGYSGYFSDPDGHLWEVAFNPHWPLKDGVLTLPK